MNCPICGAALTKNQNFETMANDPVNVQEMGANKARVVFYESADSYDFLDHQWDCKNGHTFFEAKA